MPLLIALLLSFAVACAPKGTPWPGPLSSEVLYFCTVEEGPWEVFEEDPECLKESQSRGEWDLDRLPLTVNTEVELEAVTEAAVLAINASLGFEMLVFEASNMDPDIAVLPKPNPFVQVLAYAVRGTIDGVDHGLVVVLQPVPASVIMHELGHLLGLKHDPDAPSSLMHPTKIGLVMQAEDVEVLRRLYLRP